MKKLRFSSPSLFSSCSWFKSILTFDFFSFCSLPHPSNLFFKFRFNFPKFLILSRYRCMYRLLSHSTWVSHTNSRNDKEKGNKVERQESRTLNEVRRKDVLLLPSLHLLNIWSCFSFLPIYFPEWRVNRNNRSDYSIFPFYFSHWNWSTLRISLIFSCHELEMYSRSLPPPLHLMEFPLLCSL